MPTEPPVITPSSADEPPGFDPGFRDRFADLLQWRRDVRHFRPDPLPAGLLPELIDMAALAPSVGNSQPWRFVLVQSADKRSRVIANFETANAQALAAYAGDRARLYASLKLAGLREAPVHLAVFCDTSTDQGHGLGRQSMPEMLDYSVVMAVHGFWLAARAANLGCGWVSILDPVQVRSDLELPLSWRLVAYLCVGYEQEQSSVPELERVGWESRRPSETTIFRR